MNLKRGPSLSLLPCLWVAAAMAGGPLVAERSAAKPSPQRETTIVVHSVQELDAALSRARQGGVKRIELAAGRYPLTAPILIDARLSGASGSPFVIQAQAGAKPVLSGARALTGLAWEKADAGVWRARLRSAPFQLLWLGDRQLVRARYPNYNAAVLPFGGVSAQATAPERVATWANPAGGVLHALHGSRWGSVHVPILGKNADNSLIFGPASGHAYNAPPHPTERFVENIREELDAPDEWFYDAAAGWLYYMPKSGAIPPADGFRAAASEELIRVVGTKDAPVHDVRIAGLTFRETEATFFKTTEKLLRSDWTFYRSGGLLITDARDVEIADNDFGSLGGNAIVVSGRARRVAIRRNHISRIGASAIAFVGKQDAVRLPPPVEDGRIMGEIDPKAGPRTDNYVADSVAEDNLIHDIGLIEKQVAGVQIAMSARITVDHNSIYRVPRAAINVGDGNWGGHQITNNDAFDTVRETSDHGAFNSWGRDRYYTGSRAQIEARMKAEPMLYRIDAAQPTVLRHNRFRCDHGWDIDLDDGSANYIIEDNLLLAGGLKLREGFERVARNNILLNNTLHPHVWFANSQDIFEHNIVMTGYQPILINHWGKSIDYNLFPTKADLAAAQANGTDAHSLVGAPDFVNPKQGDFRVKPGATAVRIGFRNFPMDGFGVRTPYLRKLAEQPQFPEPILARAGDAAEQPRTLAGMTLKAVETLGEQSATGLPDRIGVLVLAVEPDSPAAKAGFRQGDVILSQEAAADATPQLFGSAASVITTAQARRWTGSLPVIVFRSQNRLKMSIPLN